MGSVLTLIFSDLPTGTINQSWRCGEEAEMGSDVSQSGNPRTAAPAGAGANRPRVELRSYSAYRSTRSGKQRDPNADTAGLAQRFQPPRPRSFIQQCVPLDMKASKTPFRKPRIDADGAVVDTARDHDPEQAEANESKGTRAGHGALSTAPGPATGPKVPKLDLDQMAAGNRRNLNLCRPLRDVIVESSRSLQATRAGASFLRSIQQRDRRLVAKEIREPLDVDLEGYVPPPTEVAHARSPSKLAASATTSHGRGHSRSVSKVVAVKRNSIPLYLNTDVTTPEDERVYEELMRTGLTTAAKLFKRELVQAPRYPAAQSHHRAPTGVQDDKPPKQPATESSQKSSAAPQSPANADGSPAIAKKKRRGADAESLQKTRAKFDRVKEKLGAELRGLIKQFESGRSVSARSRMEAASKRFQYRFSYRDMRAMRAQEEADRNRNRVARMRNFKMFQDTLAKRMTGDAPKPLSPAEKAVLQVLAGIVRSPHGVDITPERFARVLLRVDRAALEDMEALRLVDQFMTKMRMSQEELNAALSTYRADRVPGVLFELTTAVKTESLPSTAALRAATRTKRLSRMSNIQLPNMVV